MVRSPTAPNAWRVRLGFFLLLLSFAGIPLLIGLLSVAGFSGGRFAAFTAGLLITSELIMVAGVALAGKEGYELIKRRLAEVLKKIGPPQTVSSGRYRAGLVLFSFIMLLSWITPYVWSYLPHYRANPVIYGVIGDGLLILSLVLLGGNFWDKLRALFSHQATVVFEKPRSAAQPSVPR